MKPWGRPGGAAPSSAFGAVHLKLRKGHHLKRGPERLLAVPASGQLRDQRALEGGRVVVQRHRKAFRLLQEPLRHPQHVGHLPADGPQPRAGHADPHQPPEAGFRGDPLAQQAASRLEGRDGVELPGVQVQPHHQRGLDRLLHLLLVGVWDHKRQEPDQRLPRHGRGDRGGAGRRGGDPLALEVREADHLARGPHGVVVAACLHQLVHQGLREGLRVAADGRGHLDDVVVLGVVQLDPIGHHPASNQEPGLSRRLPVAPLLQPPGLEHLNRRELLLGDVVPERQGRPHGGLGLRLRDGRRDEGQEPAHLSGGL
mmetsp:Transcript_73967/g.192974  ORF Transcript_73967/g.192974 Transcript_73967/m.192974 type:complete len:313 (-) Transcript_73967:1281-2219(-)